jgi:hypothetical protein
MYTADTAGGEDSDAGHMGYDHGAGDGGRTVLALSYDDGQVAPTALADVICFGQVGELLICQADGELPTQDGNGGRGRA